MSAAIDASRLDSALVVVPCGAAKLPHEAVAAALYTGSYFRMCLALGRSLAPDDRIRILSAKHGLVALSTRLAPYNVTFGDATAVSPATLAAQAQEQGLLGLSPVHLIGGARYIAMGRGLWPHAEMVIPPGLGMGRQLAWMRREIERRRRLV